MEFEYRDKQGDAPQPDDYVQRFPLQQSVIADVFSGSPETKRRDDTVTDGNEPVSAPVIVPPVSETFA